MPWPAGKSHFSSLKLAVLVVLMISVTMAAENSNGTLQTVKTLVL